MLRKLNSILFFGFTFQLVGMQITVPYKPSFTAQYPTLTYIGKSLFASGAACALAIAARSFCDNSSMRDDLNALGALGVGVFGLSYVYHKKYTTRSLVDSLLTNPAEVSDNHCVIMTHFKRDIEGNLEKDQDSKKIPTLFNYTVKQYEKESPLFFLDECTDVNNSSPCIFSRKSNPRFRKTFEDMVSGALIESIGLSSNPISYTSVGCGGVLQDLVILTRVLAQKPDAALNIHLIDVQHQWFIFTHKYFNIPQEITQESVCCDVTKLDEDFIAAVKKEAHDDKNDYNTIKTQLIKGYLVLERKCKQFIAWLQYTFPQAKISLCIHDSADHYIEYINRHNLAYPDVIAAADIQDEISGLKGGPFSYLKLCAEVLQHKPNSCNVWLGKEWVKTKNPVYDGKGIKVGVLSAEKVNIWSYSCNSVPDSVGETIDGKTIYCKNIDL